MLHQLVNFFEHYPENLLSVFDKRSSDIDAGLLFRLNDYRDRQQQILQDTHAFRIDSEAEAMLGQLIDEMRQDGLEDTYQNIILPFPAITMEKQAVENGTTIIGFLTQVDGDVYTQTFMANEGGAVPSMFALKSSGLNAEILPTPTQEFLLQQKSGQNLEEALEQEQTWGKYFLALAVGLSALLKHQNMLEVEEVAAYPRPERRRAQRSGKQLPDSRVLKIKLGKSGRGQWEAMQENTKSNNGDPIRRRTHWVRGHFMRNRSGGLSWRMPHLRGAGPLIQQERRIVAEQQDDEALNQVANQLDL